MLGNCTHTTEPGTICIKCHDEVKNAAASMFILLTRLMNRAKASNDRARDRDYWDCLSLLQRVEWKAPDVAAEAKAWMEADPNGLNQYEPGDTNDRLA